MVTSSGASHCCLGNASIISNHQGTSLQQLQKDIKKGLVVMSLELDKVYTIFLNNQHCLILHMEPRMYKMSGCAGVFSLIGHATNYVVTDVLSNFA
ncbi:uncharacterized protein [Montipora foliosa]|uniref:uncharacterized protein isoform X2 n=1 Tax=Montipora foliosa TaxID=591990 RepID=UPI0035F1BB2C